MDNIEQSVQNFLIILKDYLSRIMGPVAEVMIDDEIKEMGEEKQSMFFERIPELVIFLSYNIPNQDKKDAFLKDMAKMITDFNN